MPYCENWVAGAARTTSGVARFTTPSTPKSSPRDSGRRIERDQATIACAEQNAWPMPRITRPIFDTAQRRLPRTDHVVRPKFTTGLRFERDHATVRRAQKHSPADDEWRRLRRVVSAVTGGDAARHFRRVFALPRPQLAPPPPQRRQRQPGACDRPQASRNPPTFSGVTPVRGE
jgi:hypothetical protein